MLTSKVTETVPSISKSRVEQVSKEAGFSLAELMIVFFLFGLVATFVVLSAPRTETRLLSDAEAVADLLTRAAEETMVSGAVHGVSVEASGAQVLRYESGIWNTIPGARVYFSPDVSLSEVRIGFEPAEGQPMVQFEPIGVSSAGRIELTDGRQKASLLIGSDASIAIEQESSLAR